MTEPTPHRSPQTLAHPNTRPGVPAAHLATLLHHLYFGALMRWLTLPGLVLRDEFAVIVDLFVGGARAVPKPRTRKRPS